MSKDRSLLRKGFDWIIGKITGKFPTHIYINKVTRIVIIRFRPNDLRLSLEISRLGGWTPLANILVNGTLGTVFAEVSGYAYPNEIREQMAKYPGIVTKYI